MCQGGGLRHWALVRSSNTEPIVRILAEAGDTGAVDEALQRATSALLGGWPEAVRRRSGESRRFPIQAPGVSRGIGRNRIPSLTLRACMGRGGSEVTRGVASNAVLTQSLTLRAFMHRGIEPYGNLTQSTILLRRAATDCDRDLSTVAPAPAIPVRGCRQALADRVRRRSGSFSGWCPQKQWTDQQRPRWRARRPIRSTWGPAATRPPGRSGQTVRREHRQTERRPLARRSRCVRGSADLPPPEAAGIVAADLQAEPPTGNADHGIERATDELK